MRWLHALALASLAGTALAGEPLWLSDTPPHGGHDGGRHGHGGPVEVRRGVPYKHLWLRLGDTPRDSGAVAGVAKLSPLVLLDAADRRSEQPVKRDGHGLYDTAFPMPAEGFYNAYLAHEWVQDGTREVKLAKAEVLKHNCREGHDGVEEKMPPRRRDDTPLEILRERRPGENFHSLLSHGDTVTFRILARGAPLAGVPVSFASFHGWTNRALSDAEGRVRFTLVRDYYPPWHEFEKRHPQDYLVSAVHETDEAGEVEGKPYRRTVYRASFAGSYHPSPKDYASHAWGLAFGLFALSFSGGAVYLHRRRRGRDFG